MSNKIKINTSMKSKIIIYIMAIKKQNNNKHLQIRDCYFKQEYNKMINKKGFFSGMRQFTTIKHNEIRIQ